MGLQSISEIEDKMKLLFFCNTFMFGVNSQRFPYQVRRYSQLINMMRYYNSDFDDDKFFAYGCQCILLGDRPMSDPGEGAPIDELDTVCKKYKDCLKCARMNHDSACIGEFQKYNYGPENEHLICKDDPSENSDSACKRSLCECDLAFAQEHALSASTFNNYYHLFRSENGWDAQIECSHKEFGGIWDPQCCGTSTTTNVLYNGAMKRCCPDGIVRKSE